METPELGKTFPYGHALLECNDNTYFFTLTPQMTWHTGSRDQFTSHENGVLC